jgi:hypothetical protein
MIVRLVFHLQVQQTYEYCNGFPCWIQYQL